jgi:DNA-binding HxlR family transcriptional regulator
MTEYGQYCPMARAVEVLGDRWTLLIVRDLICGAHHFNELERGLPGISRALLAGRLKRLQQVGVVEREDVPGSHKTRYSLTAAGWELYPIIEALTRWGAKWAFGDPRPDELNPVLLLWWMRGRVHSEQLPEQRVVVEFDFREARPRHMWLVLQRSDVSVCMTHPGFEPDVWVTAELNTLYLVWLGRISFSEAERADRITLQASPNLARAFPSWFALSPIAGIVGEICPVKAG